MDGERKLSQDLNKLFDLLPVSRHARLECVQNLWNLPNPSENVVVLHKSHQVFRCAEILSTACLEMSVELKPKISERVLNAKTYAYLLEDLKSNILTCN